jgi:hypothetical protein
MSKSSPSTPPSSATPGTEEKKDKK